MSSLTVAVVTIREQRSDSCQALDSFSLIIKASNLAMVGGKDFKTDAYVYQNQFIEFMNSFLSFCSKRKMQCKELFMNI